MKHDYHKMPDGRMMRDEDMAYDMKPGGGGRFRKLEEALEGKKGVKDPGALAAAIGRKKYGPEQMAKWAAMGKRRK